MKKIMHFIGASHKDNKLQAGESYTSILRYFFPEFITCLILYCVLGLIDSLLIAQLPDKAAYTTLGYTNTLFHLLTKIAEGFSVGMVVLIGQYNGKHEFKKAGDAVIDGFWATSIVGGIIAIVLYMSAYLIYDFYQIPKDMIALGVPFLRLRAVGVFFNFVFFALIGFLRGIKNTRVPMLLFLMGGTIFLFFDYVLLFGHWGFPAMQFQGSALASVIQYSVMFVGALLYILYDSELRKYSIQLFHPIRWRYVTDLLQLSWPVMLDKAALAVCQIWLSKQISAVALMHGGTLETIVRTSFVAIKDIERFAIVPGIALAQIITFLVSNDYRINNIAGIKANIYRVMMLAIGTVGGIVFAVSLYPAGFLQYINTDAAFIQFASACIPVVSLLVIFDLVQLILSAALRGATHVRLVMWTRIIISATFFIPVSYVFAHASFASAYLQFVAVYGSLYIANALMCAVYIYWLKKYKFNQIF